MYETIIYNKEAGVATITLNRPHRLNALSWGLVEEVMMALDAIEGDDEVGVVIFTGAPRPDGRPCFSAGVDIKDIVEKGPMLQLGGTEEALIKTIKSFARGADLKEVVAGPINVFNRVAEFPKPTIAAIDGVCTAGGIELAIACDLRVVSESAQILDLHMKNLGRLGGGGLQTRLPRIVGVAKAKELMWACEPIDGKEAWRIGLANKVFPPDKMLEGAKELAKKIAAMRHIGLLVSKTVIDAGMDTGVHQSLRYSDLGAQLLNILAPEKAAEGFEAFAEKRKPVF